MENLCIIFSLPLTGPLRMDFVSEWNLQNQDDQAIDISEYNKGNFALLIKTEKGVSGVAMAKNSVRRELGWTDNDPDAKISRYEVCGVTIPYELLSLGLMAA